MLQCIRSSPHAHALNRHRKPTLSYLPKITSLPQRCRLTILIIMDQETIHILIFKSNKDCSIYIDTCDASIVQCQGVMQNRITE